MDTERYLMSRHAASDLRHHGERKKAEQQCEGPKSHADSLTGCAAPGFDRLRPTM